MIFLFFLLFFKIITPQVGCAFYVTNNDPSGPINTKIDFLNDIPIISTIPVGFYPNSIAITADSRFAYVINAGFFRGSITKIDLLNDSSVISTIPIAYNPSSIAITPNGRFAYGIRSDRVFFKIDLFTEAVIFNICVDEWPISITITPDGRFAYVISNMIIRDRESYEGDNIVTKIDLLTDTIISRIFVDTKPISIAVTPDSRFAYIINYGFCRGIVTKIDVLTDTVISTIPINRSPTSISITPDGRFAYVTTSNGLFSISCNVTKIDLLTDTVISTIPLGFDLTFIVITPDGRFAYVADEGVFNSSITKIDLLTDTPISTISTGLSSISSIAITPDSRFVYVTKSNFTCSGNVIKISIH